MQKLNKTNNRTKRSHEVDQGRNFAKHQLNNVQQVENILSTT